MDIRQAISKDLKPLQIRHVFRVIRFPVHIIVRLKLGQVGVDEVRLLDEVRLQLQACLKLFDRQHSVDGMMPERLAVLVTEIVNDQLDDVRIVRSAQSLKKVPALISRK